MEINNIFIDDCIIIYQSSDNQSLDFCDRRGNYLSHEAVDQIINGLNIYKSRYSDESILDFNEKRRRYFESQMSVIRAYEKPQKFINGYVYLIKHGDKYKIGRTINLKNRLKNHKNSNLDIEFIHSIKTDNCIKLENELHKKYAKNRIDGEWYSLNEDDILYIKNYGVAV